MATPATTMQPAPLPAAPQRTGGCCQNMTARNYIRLGFGGVAVFAWIFTASALGVGTWSQGSIDTRTIFGDVTFQWNLWRIHFESDIEDDDNTLRKNDLESNKTWRAVQFNRFAVVVSFLYTLFVAVWYFSTAGCFVNGIVDIVIGAVALLLAIFAWAGAGAWSTEFEENELDDYVGESWDDTTPCGPGCGLEAFNGVLYLALGLALIGAGVLEMMSPRPGDGVPPAAAPPPQQQQQLEIPPVVQVVSATPSASKPDEEQA